MPLLGNVLKDSDGFPRDSSTPENAHLHPTTLPTSSLGKAVARMGYLRLSEEGLERRTSEGIGSSGQTETKSQAQVCELCNEDLGRGHQWLRVEFDTQQGFPLSLQLKSEVVLNVMGLKCRWKKHVIPIMDTSLRNSSKEKI